MISKTSGLSKKRRAETKSGKRESVSKIETEDAKMTDPKSTMEVPAEIKEFAEKSIQQAEKGFDAFIDAANKSVAMVPNPTTEISKKALSFTEQNMKAAFDHARKLLHAKDLPEAVKLQTEFLKAQYAGATEQLKQLGSSAGPAATDDWKGSPI
jgi:phasin